MKTPNSDFPPLFVNSAEGESADLPLGTSSFNNDSLANKETNYLTREQRAERALLERVPPHDILAEKGIIGGVFLNSGILNSVIEIVKPEDFYVPANRILFQAFVALYKDNKPIDVTSLLIYLQAHSQLEATGGAVYLSEVSESYTSEESAKYYAEIVRDKAMQRELINSCAHIIGESYSPAVAVDELLNSSEQAIFSISERKSNKSFETIGVLTERIFQNALARTGQTASITGLPTTYRLLDHITAGLQKQDLIILAARPGMGKTAFALNLASRTAIQHGSHVAIFSLEMSAISLAERIYAFLSKVELSRLKRNQLEEEDWMKLQNTASALESAPIYIDDTAELNPLTLRAKCRRLKAQGKLDLVIVDYLQLMRSNRTDSRELEISDISRNLKALAKELDIPVIALSQLNRKVEERQDKRPMLSDLRESGAIEQDADIIMFIHREDAREKDKDKHTNVAEIIIGKHRNGSTGSLDLAYLAPYTAFENLDPQQ